MRTEDWGLSVDVSGYGLRLDTPLSGRGDRPGTLQRATDHRQPANRSPNHFSSSSRYFPKSLFCFSHVAVLSPARETVECIPTMLGARHVVLSGRLCPVARYPVGG